MKLVTVFKTDSMNPRGWLQQLFKLQTFRLTISFASCILSVQEMPDPL